MSKIARALAKGMLSPEMEMLSHLIRADEKVPFHLKAQWNVLPYSYYAYNLFYACRLARKLKIRHVSAIEFGVAGGNGLLALEQHAEIIEQLTKVKIDIYGFDTGSGLTEPQDYRDLPYVFKAGNYQMDAPRLQERLQRAQLVLGDIGKTAKDFFKTYRPAPIAFAAFDMDFYSSTVNAFRLFEERQPDEHFLPRVYMYFDDVVGGETFAYNDFTGELLAIHEFNAANRNVKIAENRAFRAYPVNIKWYHQSYIMHRFRHQLYGKYISKSSATSLALR